MAIIAKSGKTFVPAPEGLHHAVCVDVVDIGMRETKWGPKHKIRIAWQIDERQEDGKRYLVTNQYTLSLDQKANLRKDLETWRSKKFTEDELRGFDVEKLLGANCQLQVVHNVTPDGSVWSNPQAVVPAPRGVARLEPEAYIRQKDRQPEGQAPAGHAYDEDVPDDDPIPFAWLIGIIVPASMAAQMAASILS